MPALLVVFVVGSVVELYVLVKVGEAIGVFPTIALLLLDGVLGAYLFKREGRRAWRALNEAISERRVPAKEVADGALVVFGGALLITPGFLSDVLGVLCLLPPSRAVLRRLLTASVARRLLPLDTSRPGRSRRPGRVVEGEVVDPDDRRS